MESKRKLNILMLGLKGLILTGEAGGIERHVAELAPRLVERGHDVTAYIRPRFIDPTASAGGGDAARGGSAASLTYKGVKLRLLPSIPTKHLDAISHTFLASLDCLVRQADIIHYHGIGPSTLAWIPRLFKPSAKVVATFHSLDRFHQKWGPLARAYLRFAEWTAVRYPHGTIAVSRGIQEYCRGNFQAETEYIPNGADVSRRNPGSDLLSRWGLEPGGYLMTAARLVRQKGIHHLIAAYDGFEAEKKLVIVGAGEEQPGSYADYCRRLAEGNSAIVFAGFQTGLALKQLFANCYLYVHPSEAEGLSVSILEAMAAGKCVLTSDIEENAEPIDHSGVTFFNADSEDLRLRLRQLINHPNAVAELGRQAQQWVERQYGWEGIAAKTEDFYFRLLSH